MEPGGAEKAVSQLRRGVLEFCVLALLRDGERYGVEILRELGAVDALVTSEGTIYPLLSRLRKEHLVETVWRESPTGPPRRYYRLTTTGEKALADFSTEWRRFRDGVEYFLSPDGSVEE
ncbi:PadR family transcriptional regulator [Catenulispora subtropica]|uniref:PadR family transcriptional regulator n=1 Tax=Catenulispora subtropica TaxID=450798 RepID=A0ABN2SFI8_9ACTN